MIALKNVIFKSFTNFFQTHVLILTANTHWVKRNISETKMNLEMQSAAFQRKQKLWLHSLKLTHTKKMFKKFTDNSPIRVLIFTAMTYFAKKATKLDKIDLRIALSCFSDGIEVNCKDDRLNAWLYFGRSTIHGRLGKFTRHICFPLWLT